MFDPSFKLILVNFLISLLLTIADHASYTIIDHVDKVEKDDQQEEINEVSSHLKFEAIVKNKVCEAQQIVRQQNHHDVIESLDH
jgi:hypothetical protein